MSGISDGSDFGSPLYCGLKTESVFKWFKTIWLILPYENQTNFVSGKWPFEYQTVGFSDGDCIRMFKVFFIVYIKYDSLISCVLSCRDLRPILHLLFSKKTRTILSKNFGWKLCHLTLCLSLFQCKTLLEEITDSRTWWISILVSTCSRSNGWKMLITRPFEYRTNLLGIQMVH